MSKYKRKSILSVRSGHWGIEEWRRTIPSVASLCHPYWWRILLDYGELFGLYFTPLINSVMSLSLVSLCRRWAGKSLTGLAGWVTSDFQKGSNESTRETKYCARTGRNIEISVGISPMLDIGLKGTLNSWLSGIYNWLRYHSKTKLYVKNFYFQYVSCSFPE